MAAMEETRPRLLANSDDLSVSQRDPGASSTRTSSRQALYETRSMSNRHNDAYLFMQRHRLKRIYMYKYVT